MGEKQVVFKTMCGYCNGSKKQFDSVLGVSFDCPECWATGIAKCHVCGDDADFDDDDGDYICVDCFAERSDTVDHDGQK